MSRYFSYSYAAVCARGHVLDRSAGTLRSEERKPPPAPEADGYCPDCGSRLLHGCPGCRRPLVPGGDDWQPPRFCDGCGSPFPWVDRLGRIQHLENLLDREDLSPGDALIVREQLGALADPDLDEKVVVRRWKRVRELAPRLWADPDVRRLLLDLMDDTVRKQSGLG